MNYANLLRNVRTVPVAIWSRFVIQYRDGGSDIHVFFEGRDDASFYLAELRRRWDHVGPIVEYKCGGKDGVLGVMPRVQQRVDDRRRALFFVDKDVDDMIPVARPKNPQLFETEWYSIENYLVTEAMLRVIWREVFAFDEDDIRLGTVTAAFHRLHRQFCKRIRWIMAWAIALRRRGARPILANITLSNTVILQHGGIRLRVEGLRDLDRICEVATPPAIAHEIRAIYHYLGRHDVKEYIRGKYELDFFVWFVKSTAELLGQRGGGAPRLRSVVQLTPENAIIILAGRLVVPRSIGRFLDSSIGSLVIPAGA